jgi:hypothetical protein
MQEEEEEEEILGSDDDEQEAPSDYCKVNNIYKWSFIFRILLMDPRFEIKTCPGSKSSNKCRIRIRSIGRNNSVAVSDPGSGAFLIFWVRDPDLGSEFRDEQPRSYFRELINSFLG